MRSVFIIILLLSRCVIHADNHFLSFNNEDLIHQVQIIEHILDEKNDLLDLQELKTILSKILVIMKDLALGKRSYTNIAYVHGLLSVNDEIVQNITATNLSATDEIISSSLKVLPFNTAGILHNNSSGLFSSSLIVNADVDPTAAIVDTKLATISTASKVANSATTATSANTASAIVARDTSGNFTTNMITISGTVTNSTDVATKAYVDAQAGSGTSINTPNTGVRRDNTGSFAAQVVSVVDMVANGDIVLSTNPSTSTDGNIMKGSNRFIHNFGTDNTFVGENSGNFTMSGTGDNVGIGANALTANTTGNGCVAVGSFALSSNTTAIRNTAVGFAALQTNTIGNQNTAIGGVVLQSNTTGASNTAVGYSSLIANTTGGNNTAMGSGTLPVCATGSNNIAIGSGAGGTLTTGSGNIYINANAAASSEAATSRIGASQTRCFIAGIRGRTTGVADAINVLIDSSGQLGTVSSSATVKHNIEDMADQSNNILNLRPVTFVYNDDVSNTKQYGLIAEEVDQIFPDIVVKDTDGRPETVQYHVLPALLLNEMKKQQATITDLTDKVEIMNAAISNLQAQMQQFIEHMHYAEK